MPSPATTAVAVPLAMPSSPARLAPAIRPEASTPSPNTAASVAMPRRQHRQSPLAKVSTGKVNTSQVHNRILALMAHTSRYAFQGESRLARDAGVSKSAVCRLLNGQSSPSFALASAITKALEPHLQRGLAGRRLDPHELISLDGTYPTASACQLAGCRGCLPAHAYDAQDRLRPEFRGVRPGEWSLSPATASPATASPATASPATASPATASPTGAPTGVPESAVPERAPQRLEGAR